MYVVLETEWLCKWTRMPSLSPLSRGRDQGEEEDKTTKGAKAGTHHNKSGGSCSIPDVAQCPISLANVILRWRKRKKSKAGALLQPVQHHFWGIMCISGCTANLMVAGMIPCTSQAGLFSPTSNFFLWNVLRFFCTNVQKCGLSKKSQAGKS